MLRVEVYINDRRVAVANAVNISDGAAISDYACTANTAASPFTGEPARAERFAVTRHLRSQPVWALVAEMARHLSQKAPTAAAGQAERGGEP